jgi:hypothetical protein
MNVGQKSVIGTALKIQAKNQEGTRESKILYLAINKFCTWEAEGYEFSFIIFETIHHFVEQYVTYWCLILGSATLGRYLKLQPSATERARILRKGTHFHALLLLRCRMYDMHNNKTDRGFVNKLHSAVRVRMSILQQKLNFTFMKN